MNTLANRLPFWLSLLFIALALPQAHAAEDIGQWPQFQLEIRTARGTERFEIRVANTVARQEQGLMYIHKLEHRSGMLFPADRPRVLSMWMKNTLIPLDMLFIDAENRIVHIHANAKPESLDVISWPEPVTAVLELAGGECARRGIREGDRVVVRPH